MNSLLQINKQFAKIIPVGYPDYCGDMVKLVYTLASGASGSNAVRVRVSLSPQYPHSF